MLVGFNSLFSSCIFQKQVLHTFSKNIAVTGGLRTGRGRQLCNLPAVSICDKLLTSLIVFYPWCH